MHKTSDDGNVNTLNFEDPLVSNFEINMMSNFAIASKMNQAVGPLTMINY